METYNSVKIDWISEYILSKLKSSDAFLSTSGVCSELVMYHGVTDDKVRRRLRKLVDSGLVIFETEEVSRGDVEDRKRYRLASDAVTDYLSEADRDSLKQPRFNDEELIKLREELAEERSNRRELEGRVSLLEDREDATQNMLGRHESRLKSIEESLSNIEEKVEYFEDWRKTAEKYMYAIGQMSNSRGWNFKQYLDEAEELVKD